MELQVLVATINQNDHSLLERMNIQSNAIIVNQCKKNEIEIFDYKGYEVKFLSFAEKGVGLSRNNALMRATSDICLLADDDIRLVESYRSIILNCFNENPEADVIIFNLDSDDPKDFVIKKKMRIRCYNYMRFGAPRIAFRRKSVTKKGICFNLHFGGGAEYGSGEDTLFLRDCLRNKLRIISLPITIGKVVNNRPSTWFTGYNEIYFIDKGALFAAISKKWSWLLCLQYIIRKNKLFRNKIKLRKALRLMFDGVKKYENRR